MTAARAMVLALVGAAAVPGVAAAQVTVAVEGRAVQVEDDVDRDVLTVGGATLDVVLSPRWTVGAALRGYSSRERDVAAPFHPLLRATFLPPREGHRLGAAFTARIPVGDAPTMFERLESDVSADVLLHAPLGGPVAAHLSLGVGYEESNRDYECWGDDTIGTLRGGAGLFVEDDAWSLEPRAEVHVYAVPGERTPYRVGATVTGRAAVTARWWLTVSAQTGFLENARYTEGALRMLSVGVGVEHRLGDAPRPPPPAPAVIAPGPVVTAIPHCS